jgi:hypothetical protein
MVLSELGTLSVRENTYRLTHISGKATGSRGPCHVVYNGFELAPFIFVQKITSDEDLLEEVIDDS